MRTATRIDRQRSARHRLLNLTQTVLLLGGMTLLLGLSGKLLFGQGSFLWMAASVILLLAVAPRLSPWMVMRLYQARPIRASEAPQLMQLMEDLAERAGLPTTPVLHYLPSPVMNAFATGNRAQAAIALSDGMLRRMNLRELAGVLAHEISHIQHNDMWVMGLADIVSRLTSLLAMVAVFTLALSLPLVLLGRFDVPLLGLLLLLFAPSLSTVLQLALSRSREFDADLGAAELTGDPAGLASALSKIERHQGRWLERMLWPGRGDPDPSLLRSHPDTEERIFRLLDLGTNAAPKPYHKLPTAPLRPSAWQEVSRPPRRRWTGVWY